MGKLIVKEQEYPEPLVPLIKNGTLVPYCTTTFLITHPHTRGGNDVIGAAHLGFRFGKACIRAYGSTYEIVGDVEDAQEIVTAVFRAVINVPIVKES